MGFLPFVLSQRLGVSPVQYNQENVMFPILCKEEHIAKWDKQSVIIVS